MTLISWAGGSGLTDMTTESQRRANRAQDARRLNLCVKLNPDNAQDAERIAKVAAMQRGELARIVKAAIDAYPINQPPAS